MYFTIAFVAMSNKLLTYPDVTFFLLDILIICVNFKHSISLICKEYVNKLYYYYYN